MKSVSNKKVNNIMCVSEQVQFLEISGKVLCFLWLSRLCVSHWVMLQCCSWQYHRADCIATEEMSRADADLERLKPARLECAASSMSGVTIFSVMSVRTEKVGTTIKSMNPARGERHFSWNRCWTLIAYSLLDNTHTHLPTHTHTP